MTGTDHYRKLVDLGIFEKLNGDLNKENILKVTNDYLSQLFGDDGESFGRCFHDLHQTYPNANKI